MQAATAASIEQAKSVFTVIDSFFIMDRYKIVSTVVWSSSDISVMQPRSASYAFVAQSGRVGSVLGGETAALDEEHFHP